MLKPVKAAAALLVVLLTCTFLWPGTALALEAVVTDDSYARLANNANHGNKQQLVVDNNPIHNAYMRLDLALSLPAGTTSDETCRT